MNWQIALNVAGGLALFLLAMRMMTEGLKVFAGSGLKRLLARWTSRPWQGVLSGLLVTGIVQSSSAVTVATIGFVNAGVLNLRQALGVIFGANVGTTMTAWLVSLVGFGFRIDAIALPILALGVMLQLMAPAKRYQGLGEALAGFGLFFLGLAILKDAFSGLADGYSAGMIAEAGSGNWPAFLLAGILGAVLTQSSSAAIAIVLTAAAGGVISIESAAAAVIGASLGTTLTAAVAVIRATPSAKRLALGHIAFNVIAGGLALLLFPGLLWLVEWLGNWLDFRGSPVLIIALFHTLYKALGVAIMLPLIDRLATLLERGFRSQEEDLARPQHLDATLSATPALAVAALREELRRLRSIVADIVRDAIGERAEPGSAAVARRSAAVLALGEAVTAFVTSVRTEAMPPDVGGELAQSLRTARYLDEAARLAPSAERLRREAAQLSDVQTRAPVQDVLAAAGGCLALAAHAEVKGGTRLSAVDSATYEAIDDEERAAALARFEQTYERAKAALLQAAVAQRLSVEATDSLLGSLSATRRLVEQLVKGDRLLRAPWRAADIEHEADAAQAGSRLGAGPQQG